MQDLVTGQKIGIGSATDGLYRLPVQVASALISATSGQLSGAEDRSTIMRWHERLGHLPFQLIKKLFPSLFHSMSMDSFTCEVCQLAKHVRASYPISFNKTTRPFALVHYDVWGPSGVPTCRGFHYFMTLIDDYSRCTFVYLLKERSEVLVIVKNFVAFVETQFQTSVQAFRTDNAREYVSQSLDDFLKSKGIVHETSCSYTPPQNGVAERKNRHLLDVTRAIMFHRRVPKRYWGDALLTSAHLINRMPTRVLQGHSPYSMLWPTQNPWPLTPRVFGCVCFVHDHSPTLKKLDPRSIKAVFLGYSSTQKGYKCVDPTTSEVYVSRDVTFHEHEAYFHGNPLQGECLGNSSEEYSSNQLIQFMDFLDYKASDSVAATVRDDKDSHMDGGRADNQPTARDHLFGKVYERKKTDVVENVGVTNSNPASSLDDPSLINEELPIAVRKGTRSCTSHPIQRFVSYAKLSKNYKCFITSLSKSVIPRCVEDAREDPKWLQAMTEEMDALAKNDTWEVVDIPKGTHLVGSKWVFNVKYKPDGTVERYKARLVAKGFSQKYGIDYFETFAPVAKLKIVRVILARVVQKKWSMDQLDVKNAFLNGHLEEEVYMSMPPGYVESGKCCHLKKALYGLKQSPRAWFERLRIVMKTNGYKQGNGDHTLFIKQRDGLVSLLLVYVDGMIVTGDDEEEKKKMKERLATEFDLKDLGKLRYFLGIEIARSETGLVMSQRKYTLDLLKETGKLGCRPFLTPMESGTRISIKTGTILDEEGKGRYQRLVERVLGYLKNDPGKGLLYTQQDQLNIEGYSDADWAGCTDTRRSTTGYCIFLGGNLVVWRSKRQEVCSRSSAEAEYRAVAMGVTDGSKFF
ncbi:retrovirus-related Pol polyprotein from transposon RE2 isoform X2 [Nymphaea colorata]|uniref:retrovirus-related Pol polyprotein from transposon RE2 isoform X2 n=1 Tax=Nymphaea colorata TaxID=210225 RepID=UPI00214F36B4|nr:retrovirus-related Pol polyprotein from transposon RE2 isoform X2 [Nymphaea colorata]